MQPEPQALMSDSDPIWRVVPIHTTSRGGVRLTIREVLPRDRATIEAGHAGLSDRTLRMRYLSSNHKLTEGELDTIVNNDGYHRMALGAEIENDDNAPSPAGVVRYVRSQDNPEEAEMAITIADDFHGLGIGTLLLGALCKHAAWSDITCLHALVSRDNLGMLHILESVGGTRDDNDEPEIKITTPLFKSADDYPNTTTGRRLRKMYGLTTLVPMMEGPTR